LIKLFGIVHVIAQLRKECEAVIAAILDIRERYAAIGLSLAPTSSSKNVLYGLGNEYTDQQRAHAADQYTHCQDRRGHFYWM